MEHGGETGERGTGSRRARTEGGESQTSGNQGCPRRNMGEKLAALGSSKLILHTPKNGGMPAEAAEC